MADDAIERVVWTDADFEAMGWHDAVVHALGFQHDDDAALLLLDLDYIFRWIDPEPPSDYYSFLIAPATLVFEDVWDLEGDLTAAESVGERTQLVIDDLRRDEAEDTKQASLGLRRWTIDGHNFELTFLASGYRQHIRQQPIHVDAQRLTDAQRGGISFDQPSG